MREGSTLIGFFRRRAMKRDRLDELDKLYEYHPLVLSSEELGLTAEMFFERMDLWRELHPFRSACLRLPGWLREHSPAAYARRAKAFWQRGRRGWADADVWSLDTYLAPLISGAVTCLRDNLHSYPPDMTFEEWERTLTEIVEGFEEAGKKLGSDECDQGKIDRGTALFAKWFSALWS